MTLFIVVCGAEGPRPYDIGISTQQKRINNDIIMAWNCRAIFQKENDP